MTASTFSADSLPSLKGKVYLVTGGNSGCGEATVIGLAAHGAKVYLAARSEEKANASIEKIRQQLPNADVHFLQLDLGSFASVIAAAERFRSTETALHGLINNAGIMGTPFAITKDGFEEQWQTNYMSHWLLTHHLLPMLQATAKAKNSKPGDVRIANLTSTGHQFYANKHGIDFDDLALKSMNGMNRYGQSKLANILHAKKLNELYGPQQQQQQQPGTTGEIWVTAVHPGYIMTNLNNKATSMSPFGSALALRAMNRFLLWIGVLTDDWAKGALSSLWAIASAEFERGDSGAYVVPYAKVGTPSEQARDVALAGRLWAWTEGELGRRGLLLARD
ncbi:hypothetical protein MGN70_009341 [Eutypa lata]|nr:hypothetical protein MGN70_009341 [Eutypa lata]